MVGLTWKSADSPAKAKVLLTEMWAALKIEGGQLIYSNSELFDGLAPVLSSLIRFPKHWYHGEISHCTRRAALDAKRAGKECIDDFLQELNRVAQPLLDAKERPYRMWTKLSVGWGKGKRYIFRVGDCRVVLAPMLPKELSLQDYFVSGIGNIRPDSPKGGIYAVASGKFRSDQQAGDGLHRAITDLSAIVNVAYLSRRREWRSGKARPKSKLLIADNQYLFRGRRNLNTQSIWYNPDYREDFWRESNFSTRDFDLSLRYVRLLLKEIASHSSGQQIMSSMRMLAEGWASHDASHRILRSWTAFEILLSRSSDRADRYEIIAKRAAFIAKNPRLWEMRLLHAALIRNRYVHENEAGVAAEAVAQSLDAYFVSLAEWILFCTIKFESHQRLLDVFDLAPDVATLEKQAEDRQRGLQILGA